MGITKANLTNMSTAKFVQLNTELKDMIIGNSVIYEKVKDYFESRYMPAFNSLHAAFKKPIKSTITPKIAAANDVRANLYVGFCETIRAGVKNPNENISESSTNIKVLIDRMGSIVRKPLDDITASITDLIMELNGDYKKDVETLNLTDFITKLSDANKSFSNLMNERFDELNKRTQITVRTARTNMYPEYFTMCKLIESLVIIEKDTVYTDFISRFNIVLKRYGSSKSGNSSNNSTTPTTPQEPVEEPTTPIEERYPDAIEWYNDYPLHGLNGGEIFYLIAAGSKVYYKLIDKYKVFYSPESEEGAIGWEKLS